LPVTGGEGRAGEGRAAGAGIVHWRLKPQQQRRKASQTARGSNDRVLLRSSRHDADPQEFVPVGAPGDDRIGSASGDLSGRGAARAFSLHDTGFSD
jgi:hypothetical protein